MGIPNREKYKLYKPKKILGQNFLTDGNIARKIVKSLSFGKEDLVLEIGPGYGSLTGYILESTANYTAVEIDKELSKKLEEKYSTTPGNVKILNKDFLGVSLKEILAEYRTVSEKGNLFLIGNLPYNITSEVLFKLIDEKEAVCETVLMIQKEVAQRLIAKPNTKEYGILAVNLQYNFDVKILFNVSPASFFPKPKVQSSVIKLIRRTNAEEIGDYIFFKELVKNAFGKRRKTLKNSLSGFLEKYNAGEIDFDLSRRAESLSIKEFVDLYGIITGKKS